MNNKIHTNLIGRKVCLSEDGKYIGIWHSNEGPLWKWGDINDESTAKFIGNFEKLPGGADAKGEITTIHLNHDKEVIASVQWDADGTFTTDLRIDYLRVLSGNSMAEFVRDAAGILYNRGAMADAKVLRDAASILDAEF